MNLVTRIACSTFGIPAVLCGILLLSSASAHEVTLRTTSGNRVDEASWAARVKELKPGDTVRFGDQTFSLVEYLGQGGWGRVFRIQTKDGQVHAVKIPHWHPKPDRITGIVEQAEQLKMLRQFNPNAPVNAPRVYQVGQDGDFLEMDLIRGKSFFERFKAATSESERLAELKKVSELYQQLENADLSIGTDKNLVRNIVHDDLTGQYYIVDPDGVNKGAYKGIRPVLFNRGEVDPKYAGYGSMFRFERQVKAGQNPDLAQSLRNIPLLNDQFKIHWQWSIAHLLRGNGVSSEAGHSAAIQIHEITAWDQMPTVEKQNITRSILSDPHIKADLADASKPWERSFRNRAVAILLTPGFDDQVFREQVFRKISYYDFLPYLQALSPVEKDALAKTSPICRYHLNRSASTPADLGLTSVGFRALRESFITFEEVKLFDQIQSRYRDSTGAIKIDPYVQFLLSPQDRRFTPAVTELLYTEMLKDLTARTTSDILKVWTFALSTNASRVSDDTLRHLTVGVAREMLRRAFDVKVPVDERLLLYDSCVRSPRYFDQELRNLTQNLLDLPDPKTRVKILETILRVPSRDRLSIEFRVGDALKDVAIPIDERIRLLQFCASNPDSVSDLRFGLLGEGLLAATTSSDRAKVLGALSGTSVSRKFGPSVEDTIEKLSSRDPDPVVRIAALSALEANDPNSWHFREALERAVKDPSRQVRVVARATQRRLGWKGDSRFKTAFEEVRHCVRAVLGKALAPFKRK